MSRCCNVELQMSGDAKTDAALNGRRAEEGRTEYAEVLGGVS